MHCVYYNKYDYVLETVTKFNIIDNIMTFYVYLKGKILKNSSMCIQIIIIIAVNLVVLDKYPCIVILVRAKSHIML